MEYTFSSMKSDVVLSCLLLSSIIFIVKANKI